MSHTQEVSSAERPLLETKFYKPQWRGDLVARPRLIEQVKQGLDRKLTLVSAPAGSGKTTLLAECLAHPTFQDRPYGWLSLDERDNDPVLFWSYIIKAMQRILPSLGEELLMMLQAPQAPPIESILTSLINEIHTTERDLALALDDYHVIETEAIHKGLDFLLSNLPRHMHLVIASRTIPPLPLARLRAKNQLIEIHAKALRFSQQETNAFFNDAMHLDLSEQDIDVLERRTEGWVAGLQLAALSLQGNSDITGFIEGFSGDDRYIVDYLVEEVLTGQQEDVRTFLIQTSILDRLHASLCDAVTGGTNSRTILEHLERSNLFLIPLDDKRIWYRYHHLFAEVLTMHLQKTSPDRVPALHRRASEWYATKGAYNEAVQHALAAHDMDWAATVIEQAARMVFARGQGSTLNRWLSHLPEATFKERPVLNAWFAWKTLDEGNLEKAGHLLDRAETWIDNNPLDGPSYEGVVIDTALLPSLAGIVATTRSLYAQAHRNIPDTLFYARKALRVLPADAYLWRGGATAILGLAAWAHGDLQEAYQSFAAGLDLTEADGQINYKISGTHVLAKLLIAQGKLKEAGRIYRQSLALAEATPGPVIAGTADIYRGLSELACEHNDLETAEAYFKKGVDLGTLAAIPENAFHWHLVESRLKEARGDLQGALDCLAEAERTYHFNPVPDARPIGALNVRLWLKKGELNRALQWVNDTGVSASDAPNYIQEFDHITVCRILLARHALAPASNLANEAVSMLERLLAMTTRAGRLDNALATLIQLALAHQLLANLPRALAYLKEAFALAEPEGYFRVFLDEGEAMHGLLRHAATSGTGHEYARLLLKEFEAKTASRDQVPQNALPVPLTTRELEILRLIASGLKNQQIADHLFISLATVKRHIANIYSKIDARHRTEAIVRATELHLI